MKKILQSLSALIFSLFLSVGIIFAQESPISVEPTDSMEKSQEFSPDEMTELSIAELEELLNDMEVIRHEYETILMEQGDLPPRKAMSPYKAKKEWHEKNPHAKIMGEKKGIWHRKGIFNVLLHKIVFGAFMIGFLFCAAYAIRKGWEKGGE